MNDHIQQLFSNYLQGKSSEKEVKELLRYFDIEQNEGQLRTHILRALQRPDSFDKEDLSGLIERTDRRLAESIRSRGIQDENQRRVFPWKWLAGTAAALVVCGFLWMQWIQPSGSRVVEDETYTYKNDILPGENKAKLILSDGQAIQLGDDYASFQEVNGTRITGKAGSLSYAPGTNPEVTEGLTNTLLVPMAGTYQVELPDGTRVWVNSLSKLRYPVRFSTGERRVQLEGEAYFEVQKDTSRLFIVEVGDTQIQVLGTQFNVRAYQPTAQLKTTLIEGSVELSVHGDKRRLIPGETAIVAGRHIDVVPANLEEATAWKEGYFYVNGDSFREIMNDIARWYGVSLHYKGQMGVHTQLYKGSIDRNARLSQVLEMLKQVSGAEFEIDGKELYISFK